MFLKSWESFLLKGRLDKNGLIVDTRIFIVSQIETLKMRRNFY